jgi:hypothetical protein
MKTLTPTSHTPDPEYPDVPYPIIRPAVGSPYFFNPDTGLVTFLTAPGAPRLTSEIVRRELEDFP